MTISRSRTYQASPTWAACGMFACTDVFNDNIVTWNVSRVEDFRDMFKDAAAFNGDLSG